VSVDADFTPFGYLKNPGHRARSWRDTQGGNLRTMLDRLGIEWVYPTQRQPHRRVGLAFALELDGRLLQSRRDFDIAGVRVRCTHHSCLIFEFELTWPGGSASAQFFLDGEDALCARTVNATVLAVDDERIVSFDRVLSDQHFALATADFSQAVLARGANAQTMAQRVLPAMDATHARLKAEDDAFYANCPGLQGDWPAGWREGMFHDFETTRMLVQPASGIFTDVWPAWMVSWPRVVLAEGALDMLRLAYADPHLAQRAVLSMFRDAPRPNVPCVFFDGSPNMVAVDGSVCGTSPAWCLPFLNLELMYLRTLDREWLRQLYPYACAYLEWWLEHRRDADGWIVYKCTWEAGEDGNPRLDPTGSGDADISGRIRPVELQATVAYAARVLSFFATELAEPAEHWREIDLDYTNRTRQLYDAREGRYRDWALQPRDSQPYWGVDPLRYSALSLTPLLLGLPLDAEEVWRHATPPWSMWPSWTYVLVESSAALGHDARMRELQAELVDRVYRVTTRREPDQPGRPMPGASPEFWPRDWSTFDGHDAYGWGATTTNLVIRHLLGFRESRRTDAYVFELCPGLPSRLLEGGRLGIGPLTYRGQRFSLWYEGDTALLDFGDWPRRCRVLDASARRLHDESRGSVAAHRFPVRAGQRYEIELS